MSSYIKCSNVKVFPIDKDKINDHSCSHKCLKNSGYTYDGGYSIWYCKDCETQFNVFIDEIKSED